MKLGKAVVILLCVLAVGLPLWAGDTFNYLPSDAIVVAHIDVEGLVSSPLTRSAFDKADSITLDGETESFLEEAGLDLKKDVTEIVVALTESKTESDKSDVLLLVSGRFSPQRLQSATARTGELEMRSWAGKSYFVGPHEEMSRFAVAYYNSGLTVLGSEEAVKRALTAAGGAGTNFLVASPLGRDLGRISRDATAWIVVDVPRAQRLSGDVAAKIGDQVKLGQSLRYVSTMAFWANDRGEALDLGGLAISSDRETISLIEDSLRGMTAMWRLAVRDQKPEWLPVIRDFKVGSDTDSVWLRGTIPADMIQSHMRMAEK